MRALLLAVLAACESGIVIEVEVPREIAGATEVELLLGLEECVDEETREPCRGVRPPGFDQRVILPGSVYLHADQTAFKSPIDDDGIARFKIQGSGFIRYAAAVDNTERGAALAQLDLDPSAETARYRIRLEPASKLSVTRPAQSDGKFVEIWRQDEAAPASPACFGFEVWSGGSLEGRSFIVPRDDRDCDAVPDATDCADYAYGAGAPPPIKAASCTIADALPNNPADVCMLGGMGCGAKGPEECVATEYCAPKLFCDSGCDGAAQLRSCFAQPQTFMDTPHARCTIVLRGEGGHLAPCDPTFTWSLGAFPLPCEKPLTSEDAALLLPRVQPFTFDFVQKLKLVTTDSMQMTYELSLEVKHQAGCTYGVLLNGQIAPMSISPQNSAFPGYVRFGVTTPGGGVRRMLFPLLLEGAFDNTCTAQSKCELIGDRASDVFACAR